MKFLKLFLSNSLESFCFVAQIASFNVFASDETSTSQLKVEKKICVNAVKQILDYQSTTVLGDLARDSVAFIPAFLGICGVAAFLGKKLLKCDFKECDDEQMFDKIFNE